MWHHLWVGPGLKKVLCDREISLKTRAHFLQTFVRSRLLYAVQCWDCKEGEIKRLEACWHGFLRRMINNGFKRKDPAPDELENYAFVYTNNDLMRMSGTMPLRRFIKEQQLKYTALKIDQIVLALLEFFCPRLNLPFCRKNTSSECVFLFSR